MMAAAAPADDGLGASAAPAAAADAPVSSGSGVATPTAPLRENGGDSDDDDDDDGDDELPLTLDKALEEGVNRAMRGDTGVLRQVLAPGVEWRGPLGSNGGLAKVEAELRGLGNLLSEPRMAVTASLEGARRLEWIASGTWRLPWLPRFIVRGASTVETGADGKVVKITDSWEGNPLSLGLKHLIPGFWDIWHQLGSPPAEKQPYRVIKRTLGYAIREYAPRLVTQPSLTDYSNSREIRKALILPGFCHDGELKTSGRKPDEYYVTGPIEVAIQPFIATGNFPNGTWFNGTDPEAAEVRAKLIKALAADGVTPNKGKDGRIRSGILMHNSVACFAKGGKLAMSILYHRPKFIGIGNEVFVELDDEEAVTEGVVDGKVGGGTW
eukprot:g2595.t1